MTTPGNKTSESITMKLDRRLSNIEQSSFVDGEV